MAVVFTGCEKPAEIESYKSLKPELVGKTYFGEIDTPAAKPAATTDRMLAAIIPHGDKLWFFKTVGPDAVIGQHTTEFAQFLSRLHFDSAADAAPQWTLPDGWQDAAAAADQAAMSMGRFATLQMGADPEAPKLAVSALAKPEGDERGAILQNVNRWHGQMGLKPITLEKLSDELSDIPLGTDHAFLLKLVGHFGAGGMGRPPFAGGGAALPDGHPPIDSSAGAGPGPIAAPPSESSGDLKYDVPLGWQSKQPSNSMTTAAFAVSEGSQAAEITVMPLPARADFLLLNVNRWRGQLNLPPITADELKSAVKQIPAGDATASYVQLVAPADASPRQAILGAMATHGDEVWFFKLKGDADLAERERPKFEAFVKSIRFGGK